MAKDLKTVSAKTAQVAQQPVHSWRRFIIEAGAIVSEQWRHYRTDVFLGYMLIAVIAFLILSVLAKTVAYFTFDVTITHAVQTFHAGWFGVLMYVLSWIGFSPQSWIISLLVFLFLYLSGLKWEAIVSAVSLILISILGLAIKYFIARPRPSADLVTVIAQLKDYALAKDYSFPSGHVLYFTAFFGFLLFLAYTLPKHSWWRTGLLILLCGMIGLIGVSRIYGGQHWASDVLAAYLLGSVWLGLTIVVYRWGKPRFSAHQPVAKETPPPK